MMKSWTTSEKESVLCDRAHSLLKDIYDALGGEKHNIRARLGEVITAEGLENTTYLMFFGSETAKYILEYPEEQLEQLLDAGFSLDSAVYDPDRMRTAAEPLNSLAFECRERSVNYLACRMMEIPHMREFCEASIDTVKAYQEICDYRDRVYEERKLDAMRKVMEENDG